MTSTLYHFSYNAKKALVKGMILGVITILIYIIVVIVTTPSLAPSSAIKAAFAINSIIIVGTAIGVGLQFFISSYSKGLGFCRLDKKGNRGIIGDTAAAGSIPISKSTLIILSRSS